MKKLCILIIVLSLPVLWMAAQTGEEKAVTDAHPTVTIYDTDPGHLWNRLYAAIFLRVDPAGHVYGPESPDILFWTGTKHLVTEPSHGLALKVLDEFIASHGEKLIADPVKRAVMQRDLWAAYDWAPATDLRTRLAAVIKSIALTREQIEALPDNYAAAVASGKFAAAPDPAHLVTPFLPPALFQPDGPWVCLGDGDDAPLAIQHVKSQHYRSSFLPFVRLPQGRAAFQAYLDVIKGIPHINQVFSIGQGEMAMNPQVPQIPVGTLVALVRQMILIDDKGRPTATHLTESVELRVYRRIADDRSRSNEEHVQLFYEFVMDRKQLLANLPGGLRPVGNEEATFNATPLAAVSGTSDPFEAGNAESVLPRSHVMQSCISCHNQGGVFSINSIRGLLSSGPQTRLQPLHISTPGQERETVVKKGDYNPDAFK